MSYEMAGVRATVSRSVKDFAVRQCARYMKQAEFHLAQKEACAGNAQLFLRLVREMIDDNEKRMAKLERAMDTRRLRFD